MRRHLVGHGLCLFIANLCAFQAVAQEPAVVADSLRVLRAEESALQAAAVAVQDSVVQIETFGGQQTVNNEAVSEGPSSGTIVDPDGWIATSFFQFRNNPASVTVVLPDGTRKAARVVARDHSREIALLKIEVDEPLKAAKAAPRQTMVTGQWTIALGKTFDPKVASQSVGILSATRRIWDKAIQTDAKVSPFNYGGPLINLQGQTLGILAPIDPGIATEGTVQQWYDSGIGFAIPLQDILDRLPVMKEGKDIRRGLIGFQPKTKDDFATEIEVAGVIPGTPVADAGLQKGDIITHVNSMPVRFVNHLRHLLGPVDAGQTVLLGIRRDAQVIELQCKAVDQLPVYSNPYVGLALSEDAEAKQVVISAVEPGSPAEAAGLREGDSILEANGTAIATLLDFATRLTFSDYRSTMEISVRSGETTGQKSVQLQKWPSLDDLDTPVPQARGAGDDVPQRTAGIIELPFADVPNKVLAYVPSGSATKPLGVFLVAAKPGEKLEEKSFVDSWETFCLENDFAICVVGSASPQTWTKEEFELFDRALGFMEDQYVVDPRRKVVGGFDSGARMALAQAFENAEEFRAIVFLHDEISPRVQLPGAEPQLAIDVLMGAKSELAEGFAKAAQEKGYRVEWLDAPLEFLSPPESAAGQKLRKFLATLAWF